MQNAIENVGDFLSCYKKAAWDKNVNEMVSLYADNVLIFDMCGANGTLRDSKSGLLLLATG